MYSIYCSSIVAWSIVASNFEQVEQFFQFFHISLYRGYN